MTEAFFLTTYGSPLLQAMVGLGAPSERIQHRIERDLLRGVVAAELRSKIEHGFEVRGLEEAVLRALVYVRLPDAAFDERGYRRAKLIRDRRKSISA